MATATEMHAIVGKTGSLLTTDGLRVDVLIVDAKMAWGDLRVMVQPVRGSGSIWVSQSRVTVRREGDAS
jgi:hypothetical protein